MNKNLIKERNGMKKFLAVLLLLMVLFALTACGNTYKDTSPSNDQANTITAYCYVLCVKSDGFVANINDVGDVFIKYANAKQHIEVFDTVIVEYDKADLVEKSGTYTDVSGEKATYSHKLTNPKNVRVADPSKGDLVFG